MPLLLGQVLQIAEFSRLFGGLRRPLLVKKVDKNTPFLYYKGVDFEFDLLKSAATKADKNRGFDFNDVQKVWLDSEAITIPARLAGGEARWMILGLMDTRVIAVVFTYRGENTVRIISARPARDDEKDFYETQKN